MNFSMENEKKIIDIEPKKQDIDEILNWLKEEKKHSREDALEIMAKEEGVRFNPDIYQICRRISRQFC